MEENKIAAPQDSESPQLSVGRAVTIGWLVVNLPTLVIIFSVLIIGFSLVPNGRWIFLALAVLLGWLWWSFTVPRWRRWALNHGADPGKLQRWAVITGLVWRKGSVFEKTEFRR